MIDGGLDRAASTMSGDSVGESRASLPSVFRLCGPERDLSASWRLLSCEVTSSNLLHTRSQRLLSARSQTTSGFLEAALLTVSLALV